MMNEKSDDHDRFVRYGALPHAPFKGREMVHAPTVERCAQELETGLNVHRWIDLWTKDGRVIDETVAVGFYHQALQDGWEALRKLSSTETPSAEYPK